MSCFSWLPWRKPSVVVFFSSTLFDEARTKRFAQRRMNTGSNCKVDLEYVQVRHGLAELRRVLAGLSWWREVIFLLHDPGVRLHDVPAPQELDGHVDVILKELKRARPLARVLIWDYIPEVPRAELAEKVEAILGPNRVLTDCDLQIETHDHAPALPLWRRCSAVFGLFV